MSHQTILSSLINEAFIQPIRSVTVIDDEYPTMIGLMGKKDYKIADQNRLTDVITFCRNSKRNWILDIDDGQNLPEVFDSNFGAYANSDLLILDYHLDQGVNDGRSLKALNVLKNLALKPHFNLVVVHTSGYAGDGDNLNSILIDIICYLQRAPILDFNNNKEMAVKKFIDDASVDDELILDKLIDSVSFVELLSVMRDCKGNLSEALSSECFTELIRLCDLTGIKYSKALVITWTSLEILKRRSALFGSDNVSGLDWYISKDHSVNWIKTDNIFITVLGKSISPSEIPDFLGDALLNWFPHPHQLLLAKLRHEIDENGFMIANKIINKKFLHSYWLNEILCTDDESILEHKVWGVLSKHWEEIAISTKDAMIDFSYKIKDFINALPPEQQKDFLMKWNSIDHDEILKHVNKFNCSVPVGGYHINTGHVLDISIGGQSSFWVCMTPACDLEPGQKRSKTGRNIPVTLVRLYPLSQAAKLKENESGISEDILTKRALSVVTKNELVFISPEGSNEIEILSFVPNIHSSCNPFCDNFLVANQGRFSTNNKEIILFKPAAKGDDFPFFEKITGSVVAQLRYEYALHLLQMTGKAKSRVGLDFVSLFNPVVLNDNGNTSSSESVINPSSVIVMGTEVNQSDSSDYTITKARE